MRIRLNLFSSVLRAALIRLASRATFPGGEGFRAFYNNLFYFVYFYLR